MNFDFLLTPEGQKHVAIATALIIAFAISFGVHPFKKKRQAELTDVWAASDYYRYVRTLVMVSNTMEQLQATMPIIEGFFDKTFRVPISTIERKRYYSRLLEAYCEIENKLTTIPVELCKN
jgi:hypothetical protein